MVIEKLFGNAFGIVWLIVFLVAIVALIVWIFIRKDKIVEENENIVSQIENKEDEVVEEKIIEEVIEENVINKEYEIIESEDGFFRVRKIGSERTLRKFSTKKEAEEFVEEKESK